MVMKATRGCRSWTKRISDNGSRIFGGGVRKLKSGRVNEPDSLGLASGGGWRLDGSIAAFALLIVEEGFEEARAVEVRPQRFGDEDFGIGNLP